MWITQFLISACYHAVPIYTWKRNSHGAFLVHVLPMNDRELVVPFVFQMKCTNSSPNILCCLFHSICSPHAICIQRHIHLRQQLPLISNNLRSGVGGEQHDSALKVINSVEPLQSNCGKSFSPSTICFCQII